MDPPIRRPAPEMPAPPAPPERPRRAPARDREGRRALGIGLIVSVVLHGVLFLFFGDAALEPPGEAPPAPAEAPASGMRVVQVTPAPPEAGTAEPTPAQEPAPTRLAPEPARSRPATVEPPGERTPGAPVPRGAARITPGPRDPRIWSAVPDAMDVLALTPEDIRRIELLARLSALGDSAATAELEALARFDWTVKDENGGKWGISPGKIHLGDITLPLPFGFGGRTFGTGYEGTVEEWQAIQDQARRIGIEEDIQERIRAIRERKERERREKGGSNGD